MQTDITNALMLLIVGMASVFMILTIIIISAKVLTYFVNHLFIRQENKKSKKSISKIELAIATAVVEEITQGKGTIASIEKVL